MKYIPIKIFLIVILLVTGCGQQKNRFTEDGRLIIDYWEKWTGFEKDAMQAVVDDYNSSQNKVFVKMFTISQIDRKLMMATAGKNPPDVAGHWSNMVPDYAEKGALTPLNRFLEEAGIKREHYIPVFWDLCEHRGFMWALPTTPASTALHWNKRLFREAGLDPETPPRSLAELDEFSDKMTMLEIERNGKKMRVRFNELTEKEKKDKNFDLLQVGHLPQTPGAFREMWGYWFGGKLWDGKRKISILEKENLMAYSWVENYAKKLGVDNLNKFGSSFGNDASPQNAFLAEQVGMILQGVWMNNFIAKYAPHLEWGAAPFPSAYPEKLKDVSLVECDVLVIPKGAPHPAEAFDFIKFVNTQASLEKLNFRQRKFSPLATCKPEFIEKHLNPEIQTFIDLAQSPNVCYVPRLSIWMEFKRETLNALDEVLTLQKSPEEALKIAQNRMQWKFDRSLRRWDAVGEKRKNEWKNYDPR